MADKPLVAQLKPYRVMVEAGQRYLWCSCGRSKSQPYCDNSHRGTSFKPLAYTASASTAVLFCGCKHSGSVPMCDGSHNNLTDEYAEDDRTEQQLLRNNTEVTFDGRGRALLDGGCFVQRPDGLAWSRRAGVHLASVISAADGAKFLEQYCLRAEGARSNVLRYADADVVLFCLAGHGHVTVSGQPFALAAKSGVHVRAGEAFQLAPAAPGQLLCLVTVCPGGQELETVQHMPENFSAGYPQRVAHFDVAKRVSMADRFYQVLVGEHMGSAQVTQFIGQIPQSKAAPHRHLYEEAIVILSAAGMLWTETRRAAVKAGDLVFLPAEQEHSLQCTQPGGMELAGHFYPSGSPSINY